MRKGLRRLTAAAGAALLLAAPLTSAAAPAAAVDGERVLDGAVLCTFGDSLTALSDWPKDTAARLNMNLVNSGIGGNTSADGMKRFERDVLKKAPDFVLIGFGTNDFVRETAGTSRVSTEKFRENLTDFIGRIREAGGEPILLTCPYVREDAYSPAANYQSGGGVLKVLDSYNEATRAVADETGAGLIDIREECEKYTPATFLATDGVHLSAMGNTVYAGVIEAYMKEHYRQDPDAPRVTQPTRPTIPYGVVTQDLISFEPEEWITPVEGSMTFAKNDDGSLSLANTNGQWPDAHYSPASGGVAVPVKGTRLTYDFSLEQVGASFVLYFNGSTPTVARSGEELALNAYFTGAKREPTVGDLTKGQTLKGEILLSDLPIPAACIEDGCVILSGLKVFAVGTAGKPVVIREFSVTTDGSAVPPSTAAATGTTVPDGHPDGEDDSPLTPVLMAIAAAVVAAAVLAAALLFRRRQRER